VRQQASHSAARADPSTLYATRTPPNATKLKGLRQQAQP
jgi:hypothetical protein